MVRQIYNKTGRKIKFVIAEDNDLEAVMFAFDEEEK